MAQNVYYTRDHNVHNGAGDFNVNNIEGNFVQNTINMTYKSYPHLRRLYDVVAGVGASHTSKQQFARGKCLEGTRQEAIGDILEWRSSGDPSLPICWLSGTAGVGKSAIAMTVAHACEKDGLVASFFFFRSDPKRNNPDALVPTIALGLVTEIPSLQTFIDQQISQNPMLLEAHLEDQFRKLVVEPSLQMERSGFGPGSVQRAPNLVIIDGLDECGNEDTQQHILSIIQSSYQQSPSAWSPLKFLVCSRPEAWIREVFEGDLGRLTQHIALNNTLQTDRDIERYFLHEFKAIRTSRKFARFRFPSPWPSNMELGQLLQNSSSQFVYAATAVKFIKTPYSNPLDQLRAVLLYDPANQSSSSPFPELDRLYHIILSVNPNHEKLLSALAAIHIVPHPLLPSPEVIEFLLCLASGEIDVTLRGMHSVLDIRGAGDAIRVFHASFSDYLLDQARSGIFFIDQPAQTHSLTRWWLQALSAEKTRQYSVHHLCEYKHKTLYTGWIPFCTRFSHPSRELLADLHNVEICAVLLSQDWDWDLDIFNDLVIWLRESNAFDLHPNVIDHFTNRPKHFHLESSSQLSEEEHAAYIVWERAAILKINGYKGLDPQAVMLDPARTYPTPRGGTLQNLVPHSFAFMFTDCRCGSDRDLPSSFRSHQRYEAACLRTVNALVSRASIYYSYGYSDWVYHVFEGLADASLFQQSVFGSELLAQCRLLFSLLNLLNLSVDVDPWGHFETSRAAIEKRRKRLLDWLEVCL